MDNTAFSVGDKVCFTHYDDTYPGVVIRATPDMVEVQRSFCRYDGGSQKWIITENRHGKVETYTRRGKAIDGMPFSGRFACADRHYSWLSHGWSVSIEMI
jgi:hypothetical protein